jgi:hypothetical protein
MPRSLLAFVLLLACTLPGAAQSTYSPSRDTLRFREVTQMRMTLTTPQGDIPVTLDHRATIAVVRTPGDSARAWFDSLAVGATSPAGEQRPATDSALKRPYSLGFDARGRVTTASVPQFPASFVGVTDLAHQFDDFFLRLPSKSLKVGLAWSDTTTVKDSTADKFGQWTRIAQYRVERDTSIGATTALVISMKQQVHAHVEAPVPNQGMRAESVLEGTDDGYFVFAPKAGRLLGRRREGRLEGPLTMKGGQGEFKMTQSITYTSTMDALRK